MKEYSVTYQEVSRKSEDNRNPYLAANTKYHSTGGYLTVQEIPWYTPLVTAFIQGGVEMGYSHIDANAAQQTGIRSISMFHLVTSSQ